MRMKNIVKLAIRKLILLEFVDATEKKERIKNIVDRLEQAKENVKKYEDEKKAARELKVVADRSALNPGETDSAAKQKKVAYEKERSKSMQKRMNDIDEKIKKLNDDIKSMEEEKRNIETEKVESETTIEQPTTPNSPL
jgi:chromosome segregation ATPase